MIPTAMEWALECERLIEASAAIAFCRITGDIDEARADWLSIVAGRFRAAEASAFRRAADYVLDGDWDGEEDWTDTLVNIARGLRAKADRAERDEARSEAKGD